MAERQKATSISGIRADHVARYRLANEYIDGDVLDAACGCGYGSSILAEKAATVTGVDYSSEVIDFAREHWDRPNIRFYVAQFPCDLFSTYDWAVSFETVEHIKDDLGFLKNLREASERLIISAPNQDGLPFDPVRFDFHHRHYTHGEMRDLLKLSGWALTDVWHQPSRDLRIVEGANKDSRTLVYLAK